MDASTQLFTAPETCPVCSGPVTPDGDFLFCRNRGCPAKLSGSIKVWIKRLGILHWGDALIDSLTDPARPYVFQVGDIYRLEVEDLAKCCSGEKMAKKLHKVLHENRTVTLELLIASLNIPNLAVATATDIVQAGFDTVEKILEITYEDLLKIPNIGVKTARQVFDGLRERQSMIIDLSTVLDIRQPVLGPLSGLSFCVTGSTKKPRKGIHKDVMDAGGIVKESVGQGLSYLVTNEDPSFGSSKMKKAEKYGTKVISEDQLYQLMAGSTADSPVPDPV